MKVLFLTTVLPSQQRAGTEVASQAFINGLRQTGCQVSVVGYMRKDDVSNPGTAEILVGKRYIETKQAKLYSLLWLIFSLIIKLPYSAAKYYSKSYIKVVKSFLRSNQYDAVIIDHSQMGWLADLVDKRTKLIFIAHNIEHEIYLSHLKSARNLASKWLYAREAKLVKEMEANLSKKTAEVWTLTEHDASYFSKIEGVGKVRALALPPGPDKPLNDPIEKAFDIGLIGNWTWKFNQEGLQWFLNSVYPQLPSHLTIHVAGKGAEWLKGKHPNVEYEGFVPNAQVFMAQAKVVALPMQGGGGIQIKTLDALASGSTIVATPNSLRGISFTPPSVKVAAHPEEFARLLSVETQGLETVQENAADSTKNWLKARRERFLSDLSFTFSAT